MPRKNCDSSLNKNINSILGDRIKTVRKYRGISQEKMAKKIRVTRTSIVHIESGNQTCTIPNLVRIAYILEVDPHIFLYQGQNQFLKAIQPIVESAENREYVYIR